MIIKKDNGSIVKLKTTNGLSTVSVCDDVSEQANKVTQFFKSLKDKTFCKDCGVETKPGSGSARCPSCWDDKCGHSTDE